MKPSPQQAAVIDWFRDHRTTSGALIVEAVAGSGKTTTIVEAARLIPQGQPAVFCAFNKSIATELRARLPRNVEAVTLNSLGFRAVRKAHRNINVDARKTFAVIDRELGDDARLVRSELASIVAKAKHSALVPDNSDYQGYAANNARWTELADRFDIDTGETPWTEFRTMADRILTKSLDPIHGVDFDDQLWWVVAQNLPVFRYDWVIIDEAQDISHVQRMMLKKYLQAGGRLVAVGDSHQAIYGFRGADSSSLGNIAKVFGAERLPLSVSFRCPQEVVHAANKYVPQIQAAPNAPRGAVRTADAFDSADFRNEDLIVCRNTAPVIALAYHMIGEGQGVRVLGRDIGQGLVKLVSKIAGKRTIDLTEFVAKLDAWTLRELTKAGDDDRKVMIIHDKTQAIHAVIKFANAQTVTDITRAIERIFSEGTTGPRLSTIHKAKGLEAPRVFLLEPQLVPSPFAKKDWQIEQENNLAYVAITRALEELVYLPLVALGII